MFHQTRTTGRAFWLAVVVALLAVSTSGVLAARGGKPKPGIPATLTFDDFAGHAIRSDGLGPYAATIQNQIITFSTGKKRSLFFDFSTCFPGVPCESPFGSSTSGTVSNVTLSFNTLGQGRGITPPQTAGKISM